MRLLRLIKHSFHLSKQPLVLALHGYNVNHEMIMRPQRAMAIYPRRFALRGKTAAALLGPP